MAKAGRLSSKLKCMLRRWHSSSSQITAGAEPESEVDPEPASAWPCSISFHADEVPSGYRPVYVGKSRRSYLISSGLLEHPVFQNLLESSSPAVVGCEVVLFEHLLWMLENADPKPESLDELAEFYVC